MAPMRWFQEVLSSALKLGILVKKGTILWAQLTMCVRQMVLGAGRNQHVKVQYLKGITITILSNKVSIHLILQPLNVKALLLLKMEIFITILARPLL